MTLLHPREHDAGPGTRRGPVAESRPATSTSTATAATAKSTSDVVARARRTRALWLLAGVVLLMVVAAASVAIGSRTVALTQVFEALAGQNATLDHAAVAKRLPRTVLALVIGATLGVAGAVMQGVTRNPLADPGILGVNLGASLFVVAGIAWFGLFRAASTLWVAIAGAAVAAVVVYVIAARGRGGATPLKLALAGAALTAVCSSLITAISLPRGDIAATVRSWLIGGVGGASWESLGTVAPFLVVGLLLTLAGAGSLNSLALGDEVAAGLGERVALARAMAALSAVLLCGAATAVAGPIGFVGLVVPHACRLLAGPDHRWLIPLSAVAGAALLTLSDIVGRVIAPPTEVDVGILTALIGAPFFIHIVRQRKVREL